MNNIERVMEHFKWYYKNGYITARDGNAMFMGTTHGFVTASGTEKHKLKHDDFAMISARTWKPINDAVYNKKPSIETGAHIEALKQSGRGCSVHVHSPNTVALAALYEPFGGFRPQSSHLIEVLNTKWPELFRYTKVGHMVHFLEPGSKKLHDSITNSLGYWKDMPVYSQQTLNGPPPEMIGVEQAKKWNDICIMQRHGVLAIGDTLEECMEHIVRLEHISTILLKIVTASGNLESIL